MLTQVQLFTTPWTIARQPPLSMEFSRQECWSGLLEYFLLLGSSQPRDKTHVLHLLHWQVDSLPLHHLGIGKKPGMLLKSCNTQGRSLRQNYPSTNVTSTKVLSGKAAPDKYGCLISCLPSSTLDMKNSEWKWKLLSRVWLFANPWTIQSMEFSRPEYWSG